MSSGSARLAFEVMNLHDAMSWNSLIHGLAQHGDANLVLEAFSEMCSSGWQPDDSTFFAILVGCNKEGIVF